MSAPLGLFQGFGIEIEYMIVDRESLDVRPLADALLAAETGAVEGETRRGAMEWSNELALHLIEVKTAGPVPSLVDVPAAFLGEVRHVDALLEPMGARLMPGGAHPWMDPEREFRIWPHEGREIYTAFDRIFDCRGHGWANLQSVHLNLPFADDHEFGRLHAATRFLLPLLPALAASTPFLEGRPTGWLDTRLQVYRSNARRVPSVSGSVVPEPVFSRADYEGELLAGIYRDLAPLDPEGVLRHEWVNARGCIARFDRNALEIRVLDAQECPAADLAIDAAIVAVLRGLARDDPAAQGRLRSFDTERLSEILWAVARDGQDAKLEDAAYLEALGLAGASTRVGDLWRALLDRHLATLPEAGDWLPVLETILAEGCLARRLLRRIGGDLRRDHLREVYRELCDCLQENRLFHAPA